MNTAQSKKSSFTTVNPANGVLLQTYAYLSDDNISDLVESADQSFKKWRVLSFEQKLEVLKKFKNEIQKNKLNLAELITLEMGKKPSEALAEIEKSLTVFDFYFENAKPLLAPREVSSQYGRAYVQKEALGVIFCIMPWNFPVWQVLRFAVPALIAGNAIILKHSEITAGVGEFLDRCFANVLLQTDFPTLFQNVFLSHEQSALLIADRRVQGVTFTGSERGGRAVASLAGQHLKKCVLELGGMDAYLVLEDADLALASEQLVRGRFVNSGQSCVAAKRWLIHQNRVDEFQSLVLEKMKALEIAPLAHKKFQQQIHQQVLKLKEIGGKILTGGELPQGDSADYPPTALRMPSSLELHKAYCDEEIFGPVALITSFQTDEEAIAMANASALGLGGGVFSKDVARAESLARHLEAGFVAVNDFVKSEAGLPFGGVKNSGFGRELGLEGLMEFVTSKSVGVRST